MNFQNQNENLESLDLKSILESELKFIEYIQIRECSKMKVIEIQKWNLNLESMENRKYILFLEVRET